MKKKKKTSAKQGRARHALLKEGQALLDKHSMTSGGQYLRRNRRLGVFYF